MSLFQLSTSAVLVAAVTLMPACTSRVDGNPAAADQLPASVASTPLDAAGIDSVLPTATELSDVIGDRIDEVDPLIGDGTDLRDTMIGSEISESRCVGVISPLERHTYDGAPVREVAYATLPEVTLGALALPSAEAARALFDTFVDEWSNCNGRTVVETNRVSSYNNAVADVERTGEVVSAAITMGNNASGTQVRTQRALGVAENYLIDIELRSDRGYPNDAAVALTELMMTKVPKARQ